MQAYFTCSIRERSFG